MIGEKPTDGTGTSEKDQDGYGMMKSEIFFKGFRTQTTNWRIVCQDGHGVMNVDFFSTEFSPPSFFKEFRTHVVATTLCTTVCVDTLTCCMHFFLHPTRSLRTSYILMRVTHTHSSNSWKRCLSHECLCSLPRFLPFHVSPVSAVLVHPLRHPPSVRLLAELSPSLKRRTCATPHLHREVWPPGQVGCTHRLWAQRVRRDHFCGRWHDACQRSEPRSYLWRLENTRQNTEQVRCSHNVWILCFARVSWWVCSSERNPRKHASGNRCKTERERRKRRSTEQF